LGGKSWPWFLFDGRKNKGQTPQSNSHPASGYISWRGVVDAEDIADLDIPISAYIDMGPNLSIVYYYISGGRKFNWLATGPTDGNKLESSLSRTGMTGQRASSKRRRNAL
jgi:hypothetical protein